MTIYIKVEQSNEKLAHLAKDDWELPVQIQELESWLLENPLNLTPSSYIADVGFSIRKMLVAVAQFYPLKL
ncbi:hypothetical protein N480_00460 [Pseudoalteromonas luteoviolacea S2607]|uniref:hypothetical protein n=1 Tax=Pseudoalteromonas luteoviolacea TaxID=43657 RepID=UPI0007B16BDC|nr:hypothetical protein [Pseudoalteromonas luteoviolacea]KZN39333.1 hypothetical protein N480_00460 [Pseudoalteromonas luteoviolacea S2607]